MVRKSSIERFGKKIVSEAERLLKENKGFFLGQAKKDGRRTIRRINTFLRIRVPFETRQALLKVRSVMKERVAA